MKKRRKMRKGERTKRARDGESNVASREGASKRSTSAVARLEDERAAAAARRCGVNGCDGCVGLGPPAMDA